MVSVTKCGKYPTKPRLRDARVFHFCWSIGLFDGSQGVGRLLEGNDKLFNACRKPEREGLVRGVLIHVKEVLDNGLLEVQVIVQLSKVVEKLQSVVQNLER